MNIGTTYPTLTLKEIVANNGFVTDGDWVESKDQDPEGTVRLTQLADVGDGWFRDRSDRWMNDEQVTRLGVTYLKEGDVLIARMPDPLGRACVCPRLPTPAVTVVDVCIVRTARHNPNWVMHALNSPQSRKTIASFEAGSTRKRISKGNLSTIPLPMPPRPQQDRLVAEIETQFTRLDAAVATLERGKVKLKRARASVLKAAVEGRLVPTEAALARAQGRTYEAANVLLARVLAERKANWPKGKKYVEPVKPDTEGLAGLPEGWVWGSVAQLFDQRLGKMLDKAKNIGTLRPYLRNVSVRWFSFDFTDIKEMRVEDHELDQVTVREGDLVVCEGGEPGRCAVWTSPDSRFVIQKACHRLRPHGKVNPHFFAFVLAAEATSGRIAKAFTGSTIKHLTGESLCPFPIPLPPLAEQTRIVAEVDRRLSVLDALDTSVEHNLKKCARLRQSILKRAFEGKLVRQSAPDPLASATP